MGIINRLMSRIRMKEVGRVYLPSGNPSDQVIMSMPTKNKQDDYRIMEKPKPKKKRNYNKLTREEMWKMICNKHKLLKRLHINPVNMGDTYIHRADIWGLFVELNLHNSPRLTEKQKDKIKREIVDNL